MMEDREANKQAGKKARRRLGRNLVLKPAFQWKYTATVVVGVFLISAFISVQLWGILYQQARALTLYQTTTSGNEIRLGILLFALAFAVAPALAVGLWSMFVTHRICGPIQVMENYLDQLALGRFPKRRPLRKKDEFKDFYDVLWHAIYSLEERKRSDLAALSEVLRTAKSAAAEDDDQACRSAIETIAPCVESLCAEAARSLGEEYDPTTSAPAIKQPSGAETSSETALTH